MTKPKQIIFSLCLLLSISCMMAAKSENLQPGSITVSASVNSINNIANTFVPILSYYIVNNKTMHVGYSSTGWFYTLVVKDVHIDTVEFGEQKEVSYHPENNTVRVLFSGINANVQIDGSVKALWFIPLTMSHCNLTGVSM